ncbi:AsnC family protein [Brevibacillus sp. GCM10020057]|uniref:AsnC family protein n=1 Tax=Brevibacillus sp. GCM10020057 TaxID=3317327 RepID=UPI0036440222
MDRIDEAILRLLKENGRMSSSEISRQVHLSVKQIAGVVKTNTMIVLSTMKEEL